ncbi:M56 family metallopeptidase [Lapidilactobacillus luobeiensis]|uniref:M56 family metallopeptidase n=1 Tax=Lapidilactobacillus luobeiensis TaxID=2950371 RepID=UPI0021C3392E|nr:M56 family metallopeptidase [Lapidilactobacillus luobeiensis]
MQFSLFSLLISLLTVFILVVIFDLILNNSFLFKSFRIDFLLAFCVVLVLRILFPVEFRSTRTLFSTKMLPVIYRWLRQPVPLIGGIHLTIIQLLLVLWIVSAASYLIYWSVKQSLVMRKMRRLLSLVTPEQYHPAGTSARPVKMYYIDIELSPFTMGLLHPVIVIPESLKDSPDLTFIQYHEWRHIKNKDAWVKFLMGLISCVYWWFPPIHWFQKQLLLVLEIHVDSQVQRFFANSEKDFQYAESLVDISRRLNQHVANQQRHSVIQPALSSAFSIVESHTLSKRINFLLEEHPSKNTRALTLLFTVALMYLATAIIVVPYYADSELLKGTGEISEDGKADDYILKQGATYYLILDSKNYGRITNIHDESIQELKIREEEVADIKNVPTE